MKKVKLFLTAVAMLASVVLGYAQSNITVSGKVTDQNGDPVPAAGVVIEGTAKGTTTDLDGSYSLSAPSNATLVFSSIGYKEQKVAVGGKSVVNVVLPEDAQLLDETIVVAFGTSTRESFTGSAAVVNSEKLEKTQATSITNALAGKVAGVQLTSANGAPGSTSTIRIRGISSISAGNSPLIIVDGAPYGGDIATLNPNDIESMTVLKDAASNALYGARGANGVIMITTKGAKKGEAVVTFDAKVGVNTRALRNYDVITDPSNYFETVYKALDNYYQGSLGLSPLESNARINAKYLDYLDYAIYSVPAGENLFGSNGKINPNASLGNVVTYNGEDYLITPDDWTELGYRKGLRQEYNVNVSGATDRSTFYASLGYLDNEGITENSGYQRLTTRLRADYQAKKWLKIGGNMSYAHYNSDFLSNNGSSGSTGNIWAFTSQIAPIYPAYIRNADGSIKIDSNGFEIMDYGSGLNAGYGRGFIGDANPIMDNILNTKNVEGNTVSVNGFADFTILPGLKLTLNGTIYEDEYRYTYVYNPYYGQFDSTGGTVSKEHDRYLTYNLQQLLNYTRSFDQHTFSAMIGHEYYDAKSYGLWASKSNMFSQANKELSGAVVDGQSAGSSISEYNNEGYFTRLQYDYMSKFFASASLRRDASSRFHPDHRWGTFWSLGAAYIISKEPWFNVPYVDELKLKMSYGSQGNDNISNYMYTDTYDIVNSSGSVATSFSSKGNENITWETQGNFNTGIEFSLLQHKIFGSFELYSRKTTDMLFSFPVAPSMGYSSYYANVGDMKNNGFEIDLGANIFESKDFAWDVHANLTYVKNKILMLDDEKKTTTAYDASGKEYKGYQSGSTFIAEGLSLYSWYLKEYAGVDKETGESLWYKNTTDEDGNFTGRETTNAWDEADYYVTKEKGIAPFYGGFGTSVFFKGFDFSIDFSFQWGAKTYDSTYATFMSSPTSAHQGYNIHKDALKSWTSENTDSDIPRWYYNDTYSAGTSTRFLISNRYLNIENINFGYTFPEKLVRNLNIASLRLYVTLDNVWYWSARQGLDPRQGYGASDATNYSPMRSVSGGITVKF